MAPLGPDPEDLTSTVGSAACQAATDDLVRRVGDRQLVVRVDRVELSKNLVRGFLAFGELLERWPEHRGRVVFAACVYPSREGLAEYLAYRVEVEAVARRINERWATAEWEPVHLDISDDYPASMAALRRSDVLLVNPVRDGLNLVAKEGPLVNEVDGVLALSTEAGAFAELSEVALAVDPCDVTGTALVLHAALGMEPDERQARSARLRELAASRNPAHWLADQVAAAADARDRARSE